MINEILTAGLIVIGGIRTTGTIDQNEVESAGESAKCLALNMYYETRNQSTAGVLAVTSVVYNRVKDKRFPNTICKVIKQGPVKESWRTRNTPDPDDAVYYPIKNRCQFSWYCDGKSDAPHNKKRYNELLNLVYKIMDNKILFIDITDGALFYHADYIITPGWAKTKQRTIKIGDHIFYKWNIK